MTVTFRTYMIGLVVFGAFSGGMLGAITGINDAYGTDVGSAALQTAGDRARQTTNNTILETRERIAGTNESSGLASSIASGVFILPEIALMIIRIFATLTVIPSILSDFAAALGVPAWFVFLVTGVIFTYLIAEAISLYRGLRT